MRKLARIRQKKAVEPRSSVPEVHDARSGAAVLRAGLATAASNRGLARTLSGIAGAAWAQVRHMGALPGQWLGAFVRDHSFRIHTHSYGAR